MGINLLKISNQNDDWPGRKCMRGITNLRPEYDYRVWQHQENRNMDKNYGWPGQGGFF